MAIFLDKVNNLTLHRVPIFPQKSNRLDKGTILHIPTQSSATLIEIVNKLKNPSKSNFRFRYPRTVYVPNKMITKFGPKNVIYRDIKIMKKLLNYRTLGFTLPSYNSDSMSINNGFIDLTGFYEFALSKSVITRSTIMSFWNPMLQLYGPHTSRYLMWTPDNISNNVLSIGGISRKLWNTSDFYLNFLYQLRFNKDTFINALRSCNMKVVWTDYRFTYYFDPNDEAIDEMKPNELLYTIFKDLRKMRLGSAIIVEDTDDETSDAEKDEIKQQNDNILNMKDDVIVDTTAMDIVRDTIVDNTLALDQSLTIPDSLIDNLEDLSNTKDENVLQGKVKSILDIINKSSSKTAYIPARLSSMIERNENVKNKTIADSVAKLEQTKLEVIDPKDTATKGIFNKFSIANLEKQYSDKLETKDKMNILSSLSNSDNPIFLTKVKEFMDDDAPDARIKKLQLTYESPEAKGPKHTFTINVPVLRDDKFLYLGNSDKVMQRQKVALPIIRLKKNVCITTYYGKMFMELSSGNISRRLYKINKFIKVVRNKCKLEDLKMFNFTPSVRLASENNLYSEEILDITRLFSSIHIDDDNWINLNATDEVIARVNGLYFKISSTYEDKLESIDTGLHTDILTVIKDIIYSSNKPDIIRIFNESVNGKGTTNIMYSSLKIGGAMIPTLFVILHTLDWNLSTLLERLNQEYSLEYEIIPKNTKKIPSIKDSIDDVDDIHFKDFILRIQYNSTSNRTLLSQLLRFDFSELDSLNLETVLFDEISTVKEMELCNLRDFCIDPISKEVMDNIGIPSDYVGALLYANALLFNYDRPIRDTSLRYERMPSNGELIQGAIYRTITKAYSTYNNRIKNGLNPDKIKFSISPDEVIKTIQDSPSIAESSKLNPVQHVTKLNTISSKGLSWIGVNSDRAYSDINKRLWDDSFYGIMSDVGPYNENSGVNKQLSVNPNIVDIRGFFDPSIKDISELDASETMSISEALGPFTQSHDSSPRTAMALSQFSHLLPVNASDPSLVTYGMDEAISHLDSDFSYRAKGYGIVTAINDKYIKIKYDDPKLGEVVYPIDAISRNSEKSFYMPNKMVVNKSLKYGSKVNEDTIIAYNGNMYQEIDGEPVFKSGPIVYIAIAHTQNSYEDSVVVSESLADKLSSKLIKRVVVQLKPTDIIGEYSKINTDISSGDIIIKYLESNGENLSNVFGDENDLADILMKSKLSHYHGKLRDIYVHTKLGSNVKLDKSIKEFINYVGEYYRKTEGTNDFKVNNSSENYRVTQHINEYPVSKKIKINNNILNRDTILIEFFLEVDQLFSIADKVTFGNTALKGVCSTIRKDEERPYGVKTGRHIDAMLSPISPMSRMVYSFFINGYLTECMTIANNDIQDIINGK